MKNIRILSENFQFLVVKFSIYLNRHVFVMTGMHPIAQDQRGICVNIFLKKNLNVYCGYSLEVPW